MFHNIPNLLGGDLEDGELIRCLNICVSEGFRVSGGGGGCGEKRVDGAGMQFVKDAKATQHKLEALYFSRPNGKSLGLSQQALLHLALQSTPNVIRPNVIN